MPKPIIFVLLAFLALPSSVLAKGELRLQDNAPNRYVVKKGDTLWSIANKYLKDPWRWPELWRLNRTQIRNPHRIYVGDVLVLDRRKNPPQLSRTLETVKLEPRVYATPYVKPPIPAIPASAIEPFLTKPLVVQDGALKKAPRIIAIQSGTVYIGAGGEAYVTGIGNSKEANWNIYRPGSPIIDPDTGKSLGLQATYLGTARVTHFGEPAAIRIVSANQEISRGDRLVPVGPPVVNEYAPHAPDFPITGRIISVLGGLKSGEGGTDSIISINRGSNQGLEMGHVLALLHRGGSVPDPQSSVSPDRAPKFHLPDERYGLAFVFRVFPKVSYALVMRSTLPVSPGDSVRTP